MNISAAQRKLLRRYVHKLFVTVEAAEVVLELLDDHDSLEAECKKYKALYEDYSQEIEERNAERKRLEAQLNWAEELLERAKSIMVDAVNARTIGWGFCETWISNLAQGKKEQRNRND